MNEVVFVGAIASQGLFWTLGVVVLLAAAGVTVYENKQVRGH